MPIRDLQERARELGRIRVGLTMERNGKRIPVKLDRFRLTTNSLNVAQHAAARYGGQVTPWEDGRQAWQLITEAKALPVIVPPGEPLSQWYELWGRGGCERRCDGERRVAGRGMEAGPCLCPADPGERMEAAGGAHPTACKPVSRLQVMLPELPDLGVWRYETHGYNGAVELGGTTRVLAATADRSYAIQAQLRVEERSVVRGGQTSRFPVVVLEVLQSLTELAAVTGGGEFAGALGTAPAAPAALTPQAGVGQTGGTDRDQAPALRNELRGPPPCGDRPPQCRLGPARPGRPGLPPPDRTGRTTPSAWGSDLASHCKADALLRASGCLALSAPAELPGMDQRRGQPPRRP